MKIIDLQCWLVLFASVITSASAITALVADRYNESLHENLALTMVSMSGFIVALQIWAHGFAHMSGITYMAVSVACYAASRAWKKWIELYRRAS